MCSPHRGESGETRLNLFCQSGRSEQLGLATIRIVLVLTSLVLRFCGVTPALSRCHVGGDVPREKEQKAYTFSQTLRSQIRGLNIVAVRRLGCYACVPPPYLTHRI